MTITLTPRAISRITTIQRVDSNPHLALRIAVESGGCHGFQYTISLTDSYNVAEGEDTLFQDKGSSARVVMDESSLELLRGSTVDYTMELIGSQFKVLNPMATSSCGCGTSFE
jgi:iron-sulfur cluster assembly accessory protein